MPTITLDDGRKVSVYQHKAKPYKTDDSGLSGLVLPAKTNFYSDRPAVVVRVVGRIYRSAGWFEGASVLVAPIEPDGTLGKLSNLHLTPQQYRRANALRQIDELPGNWTKVARMQVVSDCRDY